MNDYHATVRAYLATNATLTAEFGQRIYAGQNLPSGYEPVSDGPALLFACRGGAQDFSSHLLNVSCQVRVFGASEAVVNQLAGTLHAAINDTTNREIAYARMEAGTMPTLLTEPDTGWFYSLSFYEFKVRSA